MTRLACATFVLGGAVAGGNVALGAPDDGAERRQVAQIWPFDLFGSKRNDPSQAAPQPFAVQLSGSRDINPGSTGQASPTSVQVFLLRAPGRFESLDYFQLRDGAAGVLGADLIDRQSVSVVPGRSVTISLGAPPAGQTVYVGVIGGFREIDKAHWRAVTPPVAPGSSVRVTLSHLSISVWAYAPAAPDK